MEKVQTLFFKSKLQSVTLALLIVSLISMFLPFISIGSAVNELTGYFGQRLNIQTSFSYFETAGLSDLITFFVTLVAIGFVGSVIYSVYNNKVDSKNVILSTLVAAFVGALNLVLVFLSLILDKPAGFSYALGFFVFVLANLGVAGLNGYKVMQNQAEAKRVLNSVTKEVKGKVESAQKEAEKKSEK